MIAAPFDFLLSVLFVVVAAFTHPTKVSCPAEHGWYVNGVRPSGLVPCLHNSVVESDAPADREIDGQIWCGVEQAIVVDERTVRCQPRH